MKRNKAVIKSVIFNDITYENNPDIVRIFNEHFSTVGRRIDDFLQSDHSTNYIQTDYLPNLSTQNSFFFRRSNIFEIKKMIMSLKNKSCHISTYSVKIIKHLSSIISLKIIPTSLINLFQSVIFPKCLKLQVWCPSTNLVRIQM